MATQSVHPTTLLAYRARSRRGARLSTMGRDICIRASSFAVMGAAAQAGFPVCFLCVVSLYLSHKSKLSHRWSANVSGALRQRQFVRNLGPVLRVCRCRSAPVFSTHTIVCSSEQNKGVAQREGMQVVAKLGTEMSIKSLCVRAESARMKRSLGQMRVVFLRFRPRPWAKFRKPICLDMRRTTRNTSSLQRK